MLSSVNNQHGEKLLLERLQEGTEPLSTLLLIDWRVCLQENYEHISEQIDWIEPGEGALMEDKTVEASG